MAGLRDALDEAYDELDSAEEVAPTETVEAAPEAQAVAEPEVTETTPVEGSGRDEQGRFAKSEGKVEAQLKPPTGQTQPVDATQAATVPMKPPQSWNAAEREAWAKNDVEGMRKAAIRLDREISKALKQSADRAKQGDDFSEATRPYEALIRQAGVSSHQYVGDLLKTAHALTYSAPHQKADLLANLIMQFGVPPKDLDSALVARMKGQPVQSGQQGQQFRDPRFDQLFQQLETAKKEREASVLADADRDLSSFADKHEFFDDVAGEMEFIFDLWAKQGKQDLSPADMERAYAMACQNNSGVAPIMEQRKAAQTVRTQQTATAKSKAAASSVRSQPTTAPAATPTGRRTALEQAYDELDR